MSNKKYSFNELIQRHPLKWQDFMNYADQREIECLCTLMNSGMTENEFLEYMPFASRRTALENLRAVLCDPEGNVSIAGSEEDKRIIAEALEALK